MFLASIVLIWLTVLGSAVGSFLNVVIYRLPAGMSLSRPGSHCPHCGRPIRWYDNVPVLGWLVLRGKCRDCRWPISLRYPAIEAVTALVFLVVGLVELLGHGANLPPRPIVMSDGLAYPSLGSGELGGIVAYHLLLVSTLLPAAMIACDGHRVPWRLWIPALVVGAVAPVVWPHLRPVPAWLGLEGSTAGAVDGLAGVAVGMFLGLAASAIGQARRCRNELIAASACVGLFLGWQAVVAVVVTTALVQVIAEVLARPWPAFRQVLPLMWIAPATLGLVLAWKTLFAYWSVIR